MNAGQEALPAAPRHEPFEAGPFRMAMGLVAGHPDAVTELDDRYHLQMQERRRLLAERRPEVLAWMPGSDAARAEVLARLATALPARHPAQFSRDGGTLHNRLTGESWRLDAPPDDPLAVAAQLVVDDLCILRPGPEGPVLEAAALCFPSRWSLAEKLGRPLAAIHETVPSYGERLARPVDRFMTVLAAGKLVERQNWSVVDDPALFQPAGKYRTDVAADVTEESAGDTLFLRVERQTLSRLPGSGTVLFTIGLHVRAVREVADRARLAEAVRAMPPEMSRYKSMAPFRDVLLGWLDRNPVRA